MLIQPSHRVAARRRAGAESPPPRIGTGRVGCRVHLALGHVVVGAVVLHPAALPQGPQRGDHVVEPLAPVVEVLAGLDVLLLAPADTDAEAHPVVGQHGRRAHRLGHGDEVADRGDVDAGGEGDVGGDGGECRDQAHRVGPLGLLLPEGGPVGCGRVRVLGLEHPGVEEVVGQVDAVVADLVGGERERPHVSRGRNWMAWWKRMGLGFRGRRGGRASRTGPGILRLVRPLSRRRGPTGRTPPGCA